MHELTKEQKRALSNIMEVFCTDKCGNEQMQVCMFSTSIIGEFPCTPAQRRFNKLLDKISEEKK